jgi:hypothetical protein
MPKIIHQLFKVIELQKSIPLEISPVKNASARENESTKLKKSKELNVFFIY